MGSRKLDPEIMARGEEARRYLLDWVDRYNAAIEARIQAENRRRARIRKLTFGRFGREPDERQAA